MTRVVLTAVVLAAAGISLRGAGEEWTQWRGPNRTGIVPAASAPSAWPDQLKKGWTVAVGEGYSSPVSGGGRVFVHARRDPDEVVTAIDLATGKVAWEQKYTAPMAKNPYAKQMAKGPYSTPLFADGRLYTLGTTAILSAWSASTGALIWRKDGSSGVDTSKLFCGTAMSPIRIKEGIVVHTGDDSGGTVTAYDPVSGKEVWARRINGPGYASPIEIDMNGTRQLVTMTTRSVVGIASSSGSVLWEFPFDDEWNENIVTPIATRSGVIVSGVRQGTRALALEKSGDKWTVRVDGQVVQAGTHKFNPAKKPAQVDAVVTEGEDKGNTMLGIYELKADTLKVCFDPKRKERPADFTSKAGRMTAVVEREKK